MRRNQELVTVVLLVVVVFSVGVLLGSAYKSAGADEVSKTLRASELDAESFLVEQDLFDSFNAGCELAQGRLREQSLELGQLGKVLGADDALARLGAEDYGFLKRKYHLMQIRTYVLEKKFTDDCGNGTNVILYYFTRDDENSEAQGQILDSLVEKYDVHVFAIELGYAKELKFLEEYYGATSAPLLVVNFEHVLPGVVAQEELVPLLYG